MIGQIPAPISGLGEWQPGHLPRSRVDGRVQLIELPARSNGNGEFKVTVPDVKGRVRSAHVAYGPVTPSAFTMRLIDVESTEYDESTNIANGAKLVSPDAALPWLLTCIGAMQIHCTSMGANKDADITLEIEDL